MQDVSSHQSVVGGVTPLSGQQNNTNLNSSPDTPGKKDRNARKQCPYCHKGELSVFLLLSFVRIGNSFIFRFSRNVPEAAY